MVVMDRSPISEPVAQFHFKNRIFVTEFSPFECSANLLAVGFQESILIVEVKLPEEEDSIKKPEFESLREFRHDTRVQSLCWGPMTSQLVAPRCLQFATSGSDHKLRLFSTNNTQVESKELKGHNDYINSIVYEPEVGDMVVTASDDHTARVWDTKADISKALIHTFSLNSPGMAVQWHPYETGKILVAQKSGTISMYNSVNYTPILSLDCCASPLLSADWCQANSLLVSAAVFSELVQFDLSRPSLPTGRLSEHAEGCKVARFSRSTDAYVASVGKPGGAGATLKVTQHKTGLTILANPKKIIGGGLSWHLRIPYLSVGNDRDIDLYKIAL